MIRFSESEYVTNNPQSSLLGPKMGSKIVIGPMVDKQVTLGRGSLPRETYAAAQYTPLLTAAHSALHKPDSALRRNATCVALHAPLRHVKI